MRRDTFPSPSDLNHGSPVQTQFRHNRRRHPNSYSRSRVSTTFAPFRWWCRSSTTTGTTPFPPSPQAEHIAVSVPSLPSPSILDWIGHVGLRWIVFAEGRTSSAVSSVLLGSLRLCLAQLATTQLSSTQLSLARCEGQPTVAGYWTNAGGGGGGLSSRGHRELSRNRRTNIGAAAAVAAATVGLAAELQP